MKQYGIIFDLDGTLWDVTNVTLESANEISKKYNLNEVTKDVVCSSFGLTKEECARKYFPSLNIKESLKYMDEIADIKNKELKEQGGNLYSNLKETLLILNKDYRLFIVSNTGEDEYIEAFLTTSELENTFEDYIAASKLGLIKGEAIKKIIKDNNIEKSIYIGDTKKDKEASEYANIPFVQAKYGFGEDLNTKYYISEFKDLLDVIKKILTKSR